MLIEFGNPAPHDGEPSKPLPGPTITTIHLGDHLTCAPGADVRDLALHLAASSNGVTQLPDHSAFVCVVHDQGAWGHGGHGSQKPSWVHVEGDDAEKAAELERLLSEFYDCPRGVPADLEDTHYTVAGPPGVHPAQEG